MKNHLKILLIFLFFGYFCLLMLNGSIKYDKYLTNVEPIIQVKSIKVITENSDESENLENESILSYDISPVLRLKMINEFHNRKNKVEYLCSTLKNNFNSTLQKAVMKMVIDTKHKLTWCPIYKAASTMWMKNFAVLSGFSTTQSSEHGNTTSISYNFIVKQKFQPNNNFNQTLKQISMTKKFMVVRHPFERLLSAYRDKLEHMQGREYYYKRYGQYITHRYRAKQSNLTSLEPSFNEFLQFVAKEKVFDEHWIPFFDACQPCSINYDYIFKFESLSDEYNFFIKENNLEYYLNYSNRRSKSIISRNITNGSIAEEYFKHIPASLLSKIFDIYKLDFFLFSYSPAKYYFMTSDVNQDLYNFIAPNYKK